MNTVKRSLRGFEVIIIFVIAFVVVTLLGQYVTHPGMHALAAICILDVVLWRQAKSWSIWTVLILAILNFTAVWVITYSHFDRVEDWYAALCLIYALLLLVLKPIRRLKTQ